MENCPMLTTIYPIEGTVTIAGKHKVIVSQSVQGSVPRVTLPGRDIVTSEFSLMEGNEDADVARSILMSRIDEIVNMLLLEGYETVCLQHRGPITTRKSEYVYYASIILAVTGVNVEATTFDISKYEKVKAA